MCGVGWERVKALREKVAWGRTLYVWTEAWFWTEGTGDWGLCLCPMRLGGLVQRAKPVADWPGLSVPKGSY